MDDNFTEHQWNFDAATEGQMFVVTEGLYPSTAQNLRSLTLILCYIQTLEPNLW